MNDTECVIDLVKRNEIIIFELILTTFESGVVFDQLKTKTSVSKFNLYKYVKRSIKVYPRR